MIYPYRCMQGHEKEVVRSVSDPILPVICDECSLPMQRVWTVPQARIRNHGYFNYGLGRYVKDSSDVKDALRQHKDKTGVELVEVGNEYKASKQKVIHNEYKLSHNEMKSVARVLNGSTA